MEIFGIKFAPLNVPIKRRLETLGAVTWIFSIAFSGVTGSLIAIYLIMYTWFRWITILYLFWIWFIDKDTSEKGGRQSRWIRSWPCWGYMRDYLPVNLEKLPGTELDPNKNYLFCIFPHGILPTGATINFGYEYSGYKTHFPYHLPHVVTLSQQFILPLGRDLLMALGAISNSPKSIEYVLSRPGGGHICVLSVGGAKEAIYSMPGSYRVALKDRKGFVKLALRNGSPLVPAISFGEPDLYGQPGGRVLKRIQEVLRRWIIVAPVIPIGRGLFQYSFGILPRRRPVTTVVGEPIDVPKIAEPTKEEIDNYHKKFIEKLTQLFEEQKYKYLEKPDVTNLIID